MSKKKKNTIIASAVLGVCILVTGGILMYNHITLENLRKLPLDLPDGFTYTAHTGCMDTPENSLESIDAAVEYGADIIEFDLHFLPDGTPVLSHDEPKGGEITLEEAFKKISTYNRIRVNVDVKSTQNLSEVPRLAKKYGLLDRIFYTGITEDMVAAVKKDSPEVPYYLNLDVKKSDDKRYFIELAEKVYKNGAIGINFNKNNASKELVDFFHENGYLVSIWTADSELDIQRLLSYSPDNITTKRPDTIQNILKEKAEMNN